jgi:hypothetical protein
MAFFSSQSIKWGYVPYLIFPFIIFNSAQATDLNPTIEGRRPQIEEFQDDPRCFIEAYKAWTHKCYSSSFETGAKYPHQVQFNLIKKNTRETDQPPHVSFVRAKRFLIQEGTTREIATEEFKIHHKLVSAITLQQDDQIYYDGVHLYHPNSIRKNYESPLLEDVIGMQQAYQYSTHQRQPQGQEFDILALEIIAEQEGSAPDNGYYDVSSLEHSINPYIYSSGQNLFLTSHIRANVSKVNSDFHEDYVFHYIVKTSHKIKLKDDFRTNDPYGIFQEGLYQKEGEGWVKIDRDFKIIPGRPLQLSHPTETRFIDELIFMADQSNSILLKDICSFSELDYVKGLNFSGRSFNEEEQLILIHLLKKINHIELLNLSKREDALDYNTLATYIAQLPSLKALDITGCTLRDDLYQKLLQKTGLVVIPQPVVVIPEPAPKPVPVVQAPAPAPIVPKPRKVVSSQIITKSSQIEVVRRHSSVGNKYVGVPIVISYKQLYNIYSDGKQVLVKEWREESLK